MSATNLEIFEATASLYHRDTGKLAPGKSRPLEMGEDPESYDERRIAYESWIATRFYRCALTRIVELEAKLEKVEALQP